MHNVNSTELKEKELSKKVKEEVKKKKYKYRDKIGNAVMETYHIGEKIES